ncbi:MAG: ankyrin repeat domain-containing protein [Fretibacterium sp.]|nr:ankyrin repeat domain-containing protein [Fretibacterium sp.]
MWLILLSALIACLWAAPALAETWPMSRDRFLKLCMTGTASEMRKAIKTGVKINEKRLNGLPALTVAVLRNEDPGVVAAMIEGGADTEARIGKARDGSSPMEGWTALMAAAGSNVRPEIVKALLNGGADVNATDREGNTALMFAAMNNASIDMIKALLDGGADVNARNSEGGTALMFAAMKGRTAETVKLLLARGAEAGVCTDNGWTALRLAQELNPIPGIVEMLAGSGPNWTELTEKFLASLDVAPSSHESYQKKLKYFFARMEEQEIKWPEREHLLAWREELIASDRKPITVLNYLTVVRKFFRWAHGQGLCADVADGLEIPYAQPAFCDDTLTRGQLQDMLNRIDRGDVEGLRDYALLSLIVSCGLSYAEAAGLKIRDLETAAGGTVLKLCGANGAAEKVSVPANVMKSLEEYWNVRGAKELDMPVFTGLGTHKNQPMSARMIGVAAKNAALKAQGMSFSPTSLRHTAVRLASQGGRRLEDVKRFARHRYIGTTFRYRDKEKKREPTCESTIASTIF